MKSQRLIISKSQRLVISGQSKSRAVEEWMRARIQEGDYPPNAKLPSDYDLAQEVGVAYMTVRAALDPLVREGLLQRVRGKGTFVAPQDPTKKIMRSLALVVPSLSSLWNVAGLYYFPGIVQGFCAEATRLGYEPAVMGRSKDFYETGGGSLAGPLSGFAGVASLLTEQSDAATIEALGNTQIPIVAINPYHGRRAISSVAADQAEGVASAVAHLAALGHRRIAFLRGPEGNLGAQERLKGFRLGMKRAGLSHSAMDGGPGDYMDLSGMARARHLLAQNRRPTAIVTAGDLIAAGALKAAEAVGLSVPGDLSVIGFGDFHVANLLQPALTTVRLPLEELGAESVNALHRYLAGGKKREILHLPTTLVERGSTGPCR